jgi:RNA polymerase sigma-70 factor (ECF subfamily)
MSQPPDRLSDNEISLKARTAMDCVVPARLRAKFDLADIFQDAHLRIQGHAAALEGRTAAERQAYAEKAKKSALTDAVRYFKTRKHCAARERSLEDKPEDASAPLGQVLAASQTSPSQKAVKAEEFARLASALNDLPPRQREAVQLHHLQGLTLEETAGQMGLSKDAVAGLLFRALKTLRRYFQDEG